uniref:Putative glycosyltransferase AGO61 n=1 Tax=Anthurium amnicola TaxID=1678845 RepID=A0A1D1Z9Y3_9ARAE
MVKTGGLSKQRSFSLPPGSYLRGAVLFLVTVFLVLLLLQIQALRRPSQLSPPSSAWDVLRHWEQALPGCCGDCARKLESATSRLRDAVTFLPLKNATLEDTAGEGTTWFMSSLNDTYEGDEGAQYLRFPSSASGGKLLCLAGNHTRDGTKNSYATAWPDALPSGAALLPGLTFVFDNYYGYDNIWHGLGAVMPFFGWHRNRGCPLPARWVLYYRGEVRAAMAYWVRKLAEVVLGQDLVVEAFEREGASRPTCFEEAVVFRHNEGVMSVRRKMEVYDMLRCKARAFCNVTSSSSSEEGGKTTPVVRMTLLLRTGARSFRNESAVVDIFRTACGRFDGCRFAVTWATKLETFCDQVRALSGTDLLVSAHGAQLTNMFFMDRNSSVMELFPKGWLGLAGPGQYVYHWLATSSGMRHRGAWRDPNGVACPFPGEDLRCFTQYYKDQQVGHDEAHFSNWTAAVLGQAREEKLGRVATGGGRPRRGQPSGCPCG